MEKTTTNLNIMSSILFIMLLNQNGKKMLIKKPHKRAHLT
jgi:hypothetical protein